MNVIVIDIGGTNIKIWGPPGKCLAKVPTGPNFTPRRMVEIMQDLAGQLSYDRIAIGYPGMILNGRPVRDPWNLGPGWVESDLTSQFAQPVRFMNDAAMQALGSYAGGRMLYIGLGTSVGAAFVADHIVVPLELGSIGHTFGKTLEEHLSKRSLRRGGSRKWRKAVLDALPRLRYAFNATEVVLGGGNAKRLGDRLPEGVRLGDNAWAYVGGCRLWECQSLGTLHHYDAPLDTTAPQIAPQALPA